MQCCSFKRNKTTLKYMKLKYSVAKSKLSRWHYLGKIFSKYMWQLYIVYNHRLLARKSSYRLIRNKPPNRKIKFQTTFQKREHLYHIYLYKNKLSLPMYPSFCKIKVIVTLFSIHCIGKNYQTTTPTTDGNHRKGHFQILMVEICIVAGSSGKQFGSSY